MIIERGGDVSEEEVKVSEQNDDSEKEIKEDDKASSVENEKSVEETDDSSKALDELQKKYDDIEDKYLRAEAEMANMTQRFKKEQEKMEYDLPYPDGESAMDVVKRSMPKLMEIVNSGLECVAIVTHGVWIRAMIAYILGMDMAKWRLLGVAFENGSITQVDYHSKKQIFTLEKLNDYAHLEAYKELLRSAWNVNEN